MGAIFPLFSSQARSSGPNQIHPVVDRWKKTIRWSFTPLALAKVMLPAAGPMPDPWSLPAILFGLFKYLDRALLENALNGVVCRLP